ncbi:conserved hypothetical protein [Desulfarculus baarsii DSM 2075]|uniref:Uncharacterized protein n=1 Tax=Desulfarculus baarsii (strain ATCC 33931 / DSM 2075 / LMG 7858 / VKM B-1802 / 2st14) TaxID=644282 RepID=E1QME0_DESB2|nr:hypothetical protein [Desulfarculus baarsii]ADK86183.1 conserved hypothetical protein [Desulfarculus baarsii DSM 2075]
MFWRTIGAALIVLCLAGAAQAHTLFMTVIDNGDGTVSAQGMYSTGVTAPATEVRLEDDQGRVLFKGRTDDEGEITFDKPKGPYRIVMDGGPGHVATADGPR